MLNGFLTSDNLAGLPPEELQQVLLVVGDNVPLRIPRTIYAHFFRLVQSADDLARLPVTLSLPPQAPDIYLPSLMLDTKTIDVAAEYVLNYKTRFMVRCAASLEEVGHFDAKYSLSPVMLLHRLGLLENAILVGGAYLDKDDLSLMAQENAKLVLTPTFSAGSGEGLINYVSYKKSGVKMALGTANNQYNPTGSIEYEARFLRLTVNAEMRSSTAFTSEDFSSLTKMTLQEFLR